MPGFANTAGGGLLGEIVDLAQRRLREVYNDRAALERVCRFESNGAVDDGRMARFVRW